MDEPVTETVEFEVKLPKPGPRSWLVRLALVVVGLAAIAVIGVVILGRSAASQIDPTAQVMPANTLLFFSITTHPEQQPNFNVIADAWKDSKPAKQIESALSAALTYSGFSWEKDILPWLGDRAAAGLIDLGGYDQPAADASPTDYPKYRAPFYVLAVQTRDRAKSDAFLAAYRQQRESSFNDSNKGSFQEEAYRGISLVYVKYDANSYSSDGEAYATINDVIVFTSSADNLKRIVDAALDGSNLTGSPNFKTTMSALPDQSVAAFYIDLNEYMDAYFKMMTAQSAYQSEVFDRIYTSVMTGTNSNDADRQKQIEEAQQQQAANAQQLRDMLSAMGGMGAVMTYEPTGIRFDIAEQLDPGRLPEKWRTLYGTNLTPADNRVFDSIPASAIIAINGHNPGAALGAMLDPGYLSMLLSNMPGITGEEIAGKIADFEKLAGVDLKSDLLDLLNGDMAFVMLPKARAVAQPKNPYFFSWPFDLALMLDSSDATKVSGSLDKLIQTALVAANDRSTKLQPMDRTPYSTLIDANGNTVLSYGAVEGRWVIGSDPDTLDAIGNAAKAPLSADETFKAATALLPTDRASTGYVQLSALWDWIVSLSGDTACDACDYLRPFKWISIANEVPANGLSKGSMHIRIEATR